MRKGAESAHKGAYTEDDLFAADGYDPANSGSSALGRRHVVEYIVRTLRVTRGVSLLDAGCGAGAWLSLLRDTGAILAGVDFSASLVEIARRALPGVDIRAGEAARLPFPDRSFDALLSYGVFLYFPDFTYATAALTEMLRVARTDGRLLIGDVPDLEKKERCLEFRRATGASLSPEHLYYPRQFFEDFAAAHSLSATISDQDVPDYANSPFRFNIALEKSGTAS